jgi:hypothetical protein
VGELSHFEFIVVVNAVDAGAVQEVVGQELMKYGPNGGLVYLLHGILD